MAKTIQFKRGTTAQTNLFVGALGEITVDTDKDVVVVHDGTTQGGFATAAKANADGTVSIINRTGTSLATINSSGDYTSNKLRATNSGTAAAPAIQVGNTDNGLYAPVSDAVAISTNGVNRFQIDGTGIQKSTIGTGTTLYEDFMCRAWVNFNGTGTVAIRGSGNVSSITDLGTGSYTVNINSPMPDTNYATFVTVGTAAQTPSNPENDFKPYSFIDSVSSFTIKCMSDGDGYIDFASVYASIIR